MEGLSACENAGRVKFHEDLLTISLFHLKQIKKSYSDVLGLNYIDHLSINIINPNNEIVFLSSTPATGMNVCSTELWKHDKSIDPMVFKYKDFYWWDECYDKQYSSQLKKVKETKNGLKKGFICVKKVDGFYLLYSFASKRGDPEIVERIKEFKDYFLKAGNHCYNNVKDLYLRYSGGFEPPGIAV